jgi:hypothetical protein
MMSPLRVRILGLVFLGVSTCECFGQIQDEVNAKLIVHAEDLMIELLDRRANLPNKWAALQEREVQNLTKLEQLEAGVTKTREFWAHSKAKNITIQHLQQSSHYDRGIDRTEAIDMELQVYKKPGLCLYKQNLKPWQIVPKVPFTGYPTTDPFNWCIGTYGSSKSGKLDESWIDAFVSKRVCVHASETKVGLRAVWGNPLAQAKQSSTATLLFDKFTSLPVSVTWNFYPKDWDPKNFAKVENRSYEKATITWQALKIENQPNLYLPTKIEIVNLGVLEEEHHEVVNRIRWLINDQVPDSLFEDPTKNEIVEPPFPDYPKEEKRAR